MKLLIFSLMIILFSCEKQNPDPKIPIPETIPTIAATPIETPAIEKTPVKPVEIFSIDELKEYVAKSDCAKYYWQNRGRPKVGYIQGVSLVFARMICNQNTELFKMVSSPATANEVKDVAAWYSEIFKKNTMDMSGGIETSRHIFTLLLGLGMRESSGKHCCGRDMSANFSSADSAEAGLFQASWGSRRASTAFVNLYTMYRENPIGCFLGTFSEGVKCSDGNAQNWGTGEGVGWQKLTKDCPAFATEWAAMLVRKSGGNKGEFGPLRTRAAEVVPACDNMLKFIQEKTLSAEGFCAKLTGHK